MVMTACNISAGESPPPSPGWPARPLLSTAFGGPEEREDLRRRMDEYMLHEEYHMSIRGEAGEVPLEALGSPSDTEMGSFPYSEPSTDIAETVSLPRRPGVHDYPRAWHPDLATT